MRKIRVSDGAKADLKELRFHIAQDNPPAAERVSQTIKDRFKTLAQFPEIGRLCEHLAPRLRHFVVGNYVIFYRMADEFIEIVRVIHAARDFPSQFQQ